MMYDLNGSDSNREWIEIYSDEGVNLSTYKFYEAGTNHKISFISGNETFLDYAIIADDSEKFLLDNPDFSGNLFDSSFSLANTNESLAIKNSSLDIIYEITYFSNWGASGNGKSLQLINNSWFECIPTAGKDNFCTLETNENQQINETTLNDSNNITLKTIIDNSSNSLPTNQVNNVISNASSNTPINNLNNVSVKNTSSDNSASNSSFNKSINSSSNISRDNAAKKETSSITGKVIYESKGEKMKILSMELLLFLLIIVIIYSIIRAKLK